MAVVRESWAVDKALAVVLWVSRLYGVVPLRFRRSQSSTEAQVSRPIHCFGVLFMSVLNITVVAYLLLQPDAIKSRNRSDPRASSNRIINIVNIFIITSAAWYGAFRGPFKMRKYLCCTTEINKIKNNLNYCHYIGPKQWHAISLLAVFLCELCTVPLVTFLEFDDLVLIKTSIANSAVYGALGMMILHFLFVSLFIKSSFKVINKCLEDVLSQITNESSGHSNLLAKSAISYLYIPITSINKSIDLLGNVKQGVILTPRMKTARQIRKLSISFNRTCHLMRELNDTENIFLLAHIVTGTLFLVITINNLSQAVTDCQYGKVAAECFWFICHIYRIVLLVEPYHRIKDEVSHTKMLVSKIMCEISCESDPMFDATDNFFKQLHLNEVSFTVMGICSLERSIISTIIGGATTVYVVITEL